MKTLKHFVESGEVPGYVAAIFRDGRARFEVAGTRNRSGAPLGEDAIFRITSMTKPITAVTTLLLAERGALKLSDPIEKWLPELAERRVLKAMDGPLSETVPANRPITVEDLLTFRMGFGFIMDFSKPYPIVEKFEAEGLLGLGAPDVSAKITYDEWLKRFSSLPLMAQPGEIWQYNTAYYLLGILLSRVSGKSPDALFKELVFDPLGMKDTGFTVPEEKLDRLTDCYWFDSENGKLEIADGADDSAWSRMPTFLDAGAGLVSTAPDYLRLASMLLNGGTHEDRPYLSKQSVEAMTRNQLTPAQLAKPTFSPDQWKHHGYGYGVSVLTSESDEVPGSVGQYGWDGGFGSSWRNDPATGTIAILLAERTFDGPDLPPIFGEFFEQVFRK